MVAAEIAGAAVHVAVLAAAAVIGVAGPAALAAVARDEL